ncbi:unnamed protein product [Clonostachys rosea]|uniref:Uncharacterized protein n=1 Tax=Bionectria ochroleuca TaxID=29856 RepID=A0ABY6UC25_BIOOC|nr:unnamed protein product [Clonostachys rosea]
MSRMGTERWMALSSRCKDLTRTAGSQQEAITGSSRGTWMATDGMGGDDEAGRSDDRKSTKQRKKKSKLGEVKGEPGKQTDVGWYGGE